MRVKCTRIPYLGPGRPLDSSPWVTVGAEYTVISLLANPQGKITLHIVTDDGEGFAMYGSESFSITDGSIPESWVARMDEGGMLQLAPEPWLADGFWEAYYDGDPTAADEVKTYLRRILA